MRRKDAGYSPQALSWATELVSAYTESKDGNLAAEVDSILNEIGKDKAELHNLLASLSGLAAHAVMVIAARIEADLRVEEGPEEHYERLREYRTKVLNDCATALREFRPATHKLSPGTGIETWLTMTGERRSGRERRIGTDRRTRAPGSSSEKINLRIYGERRKGVADRRSGEDRRSEDAPKDDEG
jgi:hypothetical protein